MSLGPEFFQGGETVKTEIKELHKFFEDWFNGRITKNEFSRFENTVSVDFELITPSGKLFDRKAILSLVRDGYATQENRRIWTENIITRVVGDVVISTYYELQEEDGKSTKRFSSAVFVYDKHTPNFCKWSHVHETWTSS